MHATRVATFLLGAWIGCCVFLDLLALQNFRLVAAAINSASPVAAGIIQKNGQAQIALLLRHFAVEQYRYYFPTWELDPGPRSPAGGCGSVFGCEVWIGAESVKLLIGGLLTALMLTFKSRKRSGRVEDDLRAGSVERMRERF